VVGACACTDAAKARPQLVVVIDTDAPLVSQAAEDESIARDAAIDTLRIDVLGAAGETIDLRTLVAPDVRDWPVSFGVTREAAGADGVVRLRIRAFSAHLAKPSAPGDVATLEPVAEVTIDRAVALRAPEDGVRTVRVVLAADCVGLPATFVAPGTTCVDAARKREGHDVGVGAIDDRAQVVTAVGTWPTARAAACAGEPKPGALCIPGGYSVLGDLALVGVGDGIVHQDPVPLRPTAVSPFFLDRTEVTVGRYRALVTAGKVHRKPPRARKVDDPAYVHCTWIDARTSDDDALPLNCVEWASAVEVCGALGGALPSAAQWEHAARGRGEHRRLPWGDRDATCCAAVFGRRSSQLEEATECTDALGPDPVASHTSPEKCGGIADVSRDGIVDLAGNVREYVRDSVTPFSAPCWGGPGVVADPVCEDASTGLRMAKGGTWQAGSLFTLSAMQAGTGSESPGWGFRCAYPASAP
jgi:formylglycine-generating enzyme required for sulfatase activity